jgi:MFS transporter (putative signal transducer)
MGVCLLPLVFLDIHSNFPIVVPLLLAHAFAAATQDASIDALCISTVSVTERGAINGWMQAGMLAGRALFGGGALLLTEKLGQNVVVALLIGVVWFSMVLVILSRPPAPLDTEISSIMKRWSGFAEHFKEVLRQKTTWLGLLFAALSGAGFEAVGAVAGPYMIDRGISTENVGFFFAVPVVLGMLCGALVGGYISDRIGRKRSVAIFLVLFVSDIVFIACLDAVLGEEAQRWVIPLLSTLYFCIGLFTASSYALFMDITSQRLGATQFSAYMGATNACESWSSLAVGKLHTSFGYPAAFVAMSVVSLLSLLILKPVSPNCGTKEPECRVRLL